MKKQLLALACVAALGLAACSEEKDASKADLDQPKVNGDIVPKDFQAVSPDQVHVFLNADSFPSIVRVCIDGVAFRVVSDHYAGLATPAVDRVAEWDGICEAAR